MLLDESHPLLARPAFAELLTEIRRRRSNFAIQKKLDDEIVGLMKRAGVYRAMVAKRFGGEEWTPTQFFRMVEEISRVDGSAGWVASFGIAHVYLSGLPLATLAELYGKGPDVVFAGGSFPSRPAERVREGLKISGRWSWASGCSGADVIGAAVTLDDGKGGTVPLIAVMRKSQVTIVENWNVNGLKGTGSHDIVVDGVVIPESWAFVRGGKSSLDGAIYRYPVMALSSQALAVVSLGIARGAIDELVKIAAGRTSITGMPALAVRPYVQSELAKAEAALRGARAFFYEMTEEAFAKLSAGDELDRETTSLLRLAAANAACTGAEVTRTIYTIAGTTGIYSENPIGQALQDSLIVPQHAFLSEATWQTVGAAMLGLDPPAGSI